MLAQFLLNFDAIIKQNLNNCPLPNSFWSFTLINTHTKIKKKKKKKLSSIQCANIELNTFINKGIKCYSHILSATMRPQHPTTEAKNNMGEEGRHHQWLVQDGVSGHTCMHTHACACTHRHTPTDIYASYINSRISGHFSISVHPHKVRETRERLQELPLTSAPQRPDDTMYTLGRQRNLPLLSILYEKDYQWIYEISSEALAATAFENTCFFSLGERIETMA